MIKGVIFDLDDTLYDYKSANDVAMVELFAYAAQRLDISVDAFKTAFHEGRKTTKQILTDTAAIHSRTLYCQHALEYLGVNPFTYTVEFSSYFWNCFLSCISLHAGVIELLQLLKSRSIKVAICTDMTTEVQHLKLQKLGLVDYVDHMITSEEVGVEKPHPKMFDETLKKMRISTSEVIMVGDSYKKDVLGALSVGIKPFWFTNGEAPIHDVPSTLSIITKFEDLIQNEEFLSQLSN